MKALKSLAAHRLVAIAALATAALAFAPVTVLAQQETRPAPTAPAPSAEPRTLPAPVGGPGWFGISMSEVTPQQAQQAKLSDVHGAVVNAVTANSPAANAGLMDGDIIVEFRGQRVEGTLELARLVRETPTGRVAKLTVWRDGSRRDLPVEVGRAPDLFSGNFLGPEFQDRLRQFRDRMQRRFGRNGAPPSDAGRRAPTPRGRRGAAGSPVLGITVQDVSGQFADYLKVPDSHGVLVVEVQAGSAAETGGLRAGDVIVSVDGQRVRTTAELRTQVRPANESRTAALGLIRNGAETMLNVEIAASSRRGSRTGARPSAPI